MTTVTDDDDNALATARQVLDGMVCECGDLEGDHMVGGTRPWPCGADDCEW